MSKCFSFIKQGYHHVDIYKTHQKLYWLLLFIYFVIILPFIVTSALFIFTKFMRCRVKYWIINAIRIACFLRARLGVANSYMFADFILLESCEKFLTKRWFCYKWRIICLETISNFDLVENRGKLKKWFLLHPSRKTVSYKNLNCILIEKLTSTTAYAFWQLKTRNLFKAIENQLLWDARVSLINRENSIKNE